MSKTAAAKPIDKTYPVQGLAKVSEAAEFLSVSRDTIYRMVNDDQIKFVTVRDAVRIPWSVLHEMVDAAFR